MCLHSSDSNSSLSSTTTSSTSTSHQKSGEKEISKAESALIGMDPLSSSRSDLYNNKDNLLNDELEENSGRGPTSSLSSTPTSGGDEFGQRTHSNSEL